MGKRKMNSDLYRIKLSTGTVYQTSKGGNYYFRYQVNGERKCVSLKTATQEEAIRKAKEFIPTVQASSLEVIASHVKVARKLAAQVKSLPLTKIWETYAAHPQRALPATVREQLSYEATLAEFLRFMGNKVKQFSQINETHTMKFADYLRTTQISVSTHNRKIVRLRKIFNTLQEYREDENPFALKVLLRKRFNNKRNNLNPVSRHRSNTVCITDKTDRLLHLHRTGLTYDLAQHFQRLIQILLFNFHFTVLL